MQHASKRKPATGGFCEWLVEVLDEKRCPNLAYWIDKDKRIFAIRWINARSNLWKREDGRLFELWMTEGSRRTRGVLTTPRVHKDMKTNFRMNLASNRFSELTDMRKTKGVNAVRWYKIEEESTKTKAPRTIVRQLPGIIKIEHQPGTPPPKNVTKASVFLGNDCQTGNTKTYSRGTSESFVWPTADHTHEANADFATPCDVGRRFSFPPVTTPHAPCTSEAYLEHYYGKVDFQLPITTPQQPITTPPPLSFQNTPIYTTYDDVIGSPADIENSSSGCCTTGDISPRLHHLGSIPDYSTYQSIISDETHNASNYNNRCFTLRDLPSDGPTVLELLNDGNEWRSGSTDISPTSLGDNSPSSNSSVDMEFFGRPGNTDLARSDGGSVEESSSDLDDMWWYLHDLQRLNHS